MSKKTSIARLSVFSNTLLIALKLFVGIITGSVSIISEAIHSVMDLAAAVIAFFSVRMADHPPDRKHPYGHGKIENISGVTESLLIFAAAIWIIAESIHKILAGGVVHAIGWGSLVMLVSAGVNSWVSYHLYKVAKETGSVALEADALHLKMDVYTSLGVCAGLGIIWITRLEFLDPLVAILVALFILKEAYGMLVRSFTPLIDTSLDEKDIQIIQAQIASLSLKAHEIRTRKAGNSKFLDMHLEMDPRMPLEEVHKTCDEIERLLKAQIPNLDVNIHVEPLAG